MKNIKPNKDLYDANPLFKLEIAKYRLSFSTKVPISIKGLAPVLRSRFGFILKKRFCPFQNYEKISCKACKNALTCLYIILFSPSKESIKPEFKGQGRCHLNPPRPYCLNVIFKNNTNKIMPPKTVPQENEPQKTKPKENAQIELTLFGKKAIQYQRPMLESIIHALTSIHVSKLNLVADNNIAHNNINVFYPLTPFFWETIVPEKKDDKMQIIVKNDKYITDNVLYNTLEQWINALPKPEITYDNNGVSMLEIVFKTPFQLARAASKFTFTAFMQSIISRIRDLKRIYHIDNDMGDFSKNFYSKIENITIFKNLKNIELIRYSYSQKKNIKMGGLKGTLILKGDIKPFLPLIKAGFLTGVGKKTVYGLGHFDLYNKPFE
ncbi:MAG: hypothetical protein B6I26_06380 [Desulfobacteraceae bacterium 4572_130]|nr:MAG: hypothetical protein B6I26_06380 [Desulfobacteraceae bacterium 4572_130]